MPRRPGIALLLLLLLAASLRVVYFTGLQTGDDIVYSRVVVDRLSGKVDVSNTQQTRNGFLLPILAATAVLGPGEASLMLYNLVCSTALVAVLFFLGRRLFGDVAGAAAGLVAAVHPTLVRFASECHTDTPLVLWLALALLAFLSALDADPGARLRVLAGLLLGWAWLHKESTVYMGLFFAGHWIATRRSWRWYLPVALPLAATVVVELIGFAWLTGNPMARYSMVRHWHTQYMAERYTTAASILHRQFVELPLLLFTPWYGRTGTGLINLAGLVSGAFLLWRRLPGGGVLAGWFLAFYGAYCFWPSSLSPFMPGFFLFEWTLPVLAAPLAAMAGAAASRIPRPSAGAAAAAIVAVGVFTLHANRDEGRSLSAGAREARIWIAAQPVARIIADDKTIEALDFFEGHRPARQYLSFQQTSEYAGAAVIVDKFWSQRDRWWSRPVPEIVLHPPAAWRKVFESDRIVIYRP